MENLDRSIPFIVLAAVGLLLLFLLRRNESLSSPAGRGAGGERTTPLAPPEVIPDAIPLPVETPQPVAAPIATVRPRKKPAAIAAPQPTPIDTVVDLLKQKDTLVAAFLLREIFDCPLSRREPRTK